MKRAFAMPIAVLALAYFLMAKLGLELAVQYGQVGIAWVPAGIALAALLIRGIGLWPGVLLGSFVANLSVGSSPATALAIAIGATLEAVAAAWVMRRWGGHLDGLSSVRSVLSLVAAAALGMSAISASIGVSALYLSGTVARDVFGAAWRAWWLGDALGIVIILPLILAWRVDLPRHLATVQSALSNWRALLAGAPMVAAATVFVVSPQASLPQQLPLLAIGPIAVVAALFAGVKAVTLSNFLIAGIIVVGTLTGYGPFAEGSAAGTFALQVSIYALTFTTLLAVAARVERQAAAREAEGSQTLFATLFHNSPVPIVISRLVDGRFFEANPAAFELFGYLREEVLGKTTLELGVWVDEAGRNRLIDLLKTTGRAEGLELQLRRSDGAHVDVLYSAQVVPFQGEPCIIATIHNVTERKRAETALRQSEERFARVFHSSPDAIVISRLSDGTYIDANEAWERLCGYPRDEVIGRRSTELGIWVQPRDRERLMVHLANNRTVRDFEFKLRRRSGEVAEALLSGEVVTVGGEECLLSLLSDITERKRAELQLRASERRFADVLEAAGEYVWESNLQQQYTFASSRLEKVLGYPVAELMGKSAVDFMPAGEAERVRAWFAANREIGKPFKNLEHVSETSDGRIIWQQVSGVPVFDADGNLQGYRGTGLDITERKNAEMQLRLSERRFADVLEAAGEYVWETDVDARLIFLSARVEKVLGYAPGEMIGKVASDFMPPDEAERVRQWFTDNHKPGQPIRGLEHVSITKDGKHIWQRISAVPVFDANGELLGNRGTGLDITERKEAEQRIEELATRDSLTQLPNRRLLMDRLSQGILAAQRNNTMLGVLFIDLDRFKTINDSLGHAAGDSLLKQVAQRIASLMRKGDTLARLGGDEFVIVLEELRAPERAGTIAQKLINALSQPFPFETRELNTSASIGVSVFPNDAQDGATLLRNADMAMYFAKEHGRHNYQFYSQEMNARAVEKLAMESTLRRAVENGELDLYYHPKFDLRNGHLAGVEALLRWRHPQFGLVMPDRFIPIAEETGLIVPIGEWVLEQASLQGFEWERRFGRRVPVAVNLSVGQFNKTLTRNVHDALKRTGLDPGSLELEITESLLMNNAEEHIEMLRQLSDLGVNIAIDDFGTGYSSLAYLRRLRIDTLKIDQSFVRDVDTNLDDAAIVEAIVAMGRSLKLTVIAEGVETQQQKNVLTQLQCDQGQGFLFCEPLPAAEFERNYLLQPRVATH
jgi:diguanylate cyclase (GGDEF)-like protein/PAS domain S-box-containing protein